MVTVALWASLCANLWACNASKQPGATALGSTEAPLGASTGAASDKGAPEKHATLEIPAAGKELKPPADPHDLPSGVWYCDMGKVHWAQGEEGNRQCPLCKMELKQKK